MSEKFQIGDSFSIGKEVQHPGLHISLAGWQGRLVDIVVEDGETYLAVEWDSQTLQHMPEGLAQFSLDADWEWRGWIFTPNQLLAAAPRDTAADAQAVVEKIASGLRQDVRGFRPDELIGNASMPYPEDEEGEFFDLPLFLAVLQIPVIDHEAVAEGLAAGAGAYYQQHYGHWRYGKRPFFLIPTLMAKAPTFGYGVLAVLADERISLESRKKIAYFACQTTDPFAPDHTPYGLISIVSFLAAHGALRVDLFRSVLLALELSGLDQKLAGWSFAEAQNLTTWLVGETAVPEPEKLWWLWYISAHLPRALGEELLPTWLAHTALPLDLRLELAWGWLMGEEELGQPPANWRLMAATFAGDAEQAEAITAEMNLVEAATVAEDEALDDLLRAPHIPPMPDHHGPGNDPVGFLNMLMGMRFGTPLLHPSFVRRYAVQGVAELENNPLELFQMVLAESDAHNEVLRHGVLDVLPAFGDRFTAVQKRQLLHMGLIVSKADVRQRIYELGARWLGDEFVQEAMSDPAKSIRDWAVAQQEMGHK